jgi:hypothetical protein
MQVGDCEELNAVDEVLCKGRQTPLLIGSVRSNMGHSEPVSGLCSVTKMIIAMENGLIPANLNFRNPRHDVEGLITGRLKVNIMLVLIFLNVLCTVLPALVVLMFIADTELVAIKLNLNHSECILVAMVCSNYTLIRRVKSSWHSQRTGLSIFFFLYGNIKCMISLT